MFSSIQKPKLFNLLPQKTSQEVKTNTFTSKCKIIQNVSITTKKQAQFSHHHLSLFPLFLSQFNQALQNTFNGTIAVIDRGIFERRHISPVIIGEDLVIFSARCLLTDTRLFTGLRWKLAMLSVSDQFPPLPRSQESSSVCPRESDFV